MFIRYEVPRGTIHDLEHINTLSADSNRIILVSERTLYLLQNLAASDIAFTRRYASQLGEHGYYTVEPGTDDETLMLDVIDRAQYEVFDLSSEIGDGLQAIADALALLADKPGDTIQVYGGGDGCSLPDVVVNCIVNLPNDQLLPPADDVVPPYQGDPPDGFDTWDEYLIYKCKAAHFIWALERKYMVALRTLDLVYLTAAVVGPIVAGLAGALPAVFTPAGFVAFVASVVAIGVTAAFAWFFMDEMIAQWDADKDDIICALYYSGSSSAAVNALAGFTEDAIQAIITWGVLAPVAGTISGLLSTAFAALVGNGLVAPLFRVIVDVTGYEYSCAGCEDPECNCPPSGYGYFGTGDTTANGEQRTWYGAANGNDSAIYIDLPCNREFEVVAIRNCTDWDGGFPIWREMNVSAECVWDTQYHNDYYYCYQIPGLVGNAARFAIDSKDTAATPVEVDIIIFPD